MNFEILSEIPDRLKGVHDNPNIVAPSFEELEELAAIDCIEKRVVVVTNGDNIEACAVCYTEYRQHHGVKLKVYSLFGYLLHDYSRILCKTPEAFEMLKKAVYEDSQKTGCDLIEWNNIPAELLPEGCLPIHTEIKLFSSQECEQGWARFYKNKHVKYLINKAKKLPNGYRVEVNDGFVADDLMNQLSQFHIYRWQFAGSSSPFASNIKRTLEYRAHSSNKHYLRILTGGELIACHYGMKYGDTLLFHTPIINPKYMDLSPMKLILAETAKYCESNGIINIDFGLGDEAYKDGYCTLPRFTCFYEKPVTPKGNIAILFGKMSKTKLFKHLNYFRSKFKATCNRFVSKFEYDEIVYKEAINCRKDKYDIIIINNWPDFCDYSAKKSMQIYKYQFSRFHQDKELVFIAIEENGICKTYGWLGENNDATRNDINNCSANFYLFDIHYETTQDIDILLEAVYSTTNASFSVVADRKLKKYIQALIS